MRQYDKAKEYIDKMLNDKIDDQSCEACELNFMLDYYLETGQFDEAYSRAQPLINKQVTCYEANLRAYLKLSYYAQKAGKPELPPICVHVPKKHCWEEKRMNIFCFTWDCLLLII